MKPVGKIGSLVGPNGRIIMTNNNLTFTNGIPISVIGDLVSPHIPFPNPIIHGFARIITGSNLFFINGKPVTRLGDLASCGHKVNTGDNLVFTK